MSRIFLSPPDVRGAEIQSIASAINSNWIAPVGPDLDQFEIDIANICQMPFGIGVSSGTAALHLALLLLGVGPNDEVLVPTLTFIPTANTVLYTGARPYFLDVEEESLGLDPTLVEEVLREKAKQKKLPKAAMVVDLYGQCADYRQLLPIFQRYEIPVIEDAAEALGAFRDDQAAGSFGEFGIISFNGNKIITTSSGGMLLAGNETMARQARKLATQARDDAAHYEHSVVGYNYRLSNLLAAFGRAQLSTLNERITCRQLIRKNYESALAEFDGVKLLSVAPGSSPNYWLTCISIEPEVTGVTPLTLREKLENADIESRQIWKPMHLQPLFRGSERYLNGTAERIFAQGLCLPSGSSLSPKDQERVIGVLRRTFAHRG